MELLLALPVLLPLGGAGVTLLMRHHARIQLWMAILTLVAIFTVIESVNLPDRGIQQADYKVLRENRDLAVLIELGFITNPDDFSEIHSPEYKNQVGEAIANGLINYFHQP